MTQDNIPDKCNLCALKQTWPLNTDAKFQEINMLFEKGIIKRRFIRKMHIGGDKDDIAEFCLISHPDFNNKLAKCDAWQLDVGLPKGDSLAIHLAEEATTAAKETERLTSQLNSLTVKIRNMTKVITVLTIVAMVLSILTFYITIK